MFLDALGAAGEEELGLDDEKAGNAVVLQFRRKGKGQGTKMDRNR